MLMVRCLVPVTDRSRHHPLFFAQIRGSAAPTCSQHHSIMHMTCAYWSWMACRCMHREGTREMTICTCNGNLTTMACDIFEHVLYVMTATYQGALNESAAG
jgi:hypothetical protein